MASNSTADLRIELIAEPQDVVDSFDSICNAFGHQTRDGIWIAMNPGWDTPTGKAAGAARMVERWKSSTKDNKGNLNTMFVKATLPDPQDEGHRIIAGIAIWVQASMVNGHGDKPAEDLSKIMDLEAVYPGNKAEQRYMCQLDHSLHKRRIEVVRQKETESPSAVLVLDLCVVDPAFQRRGIAQKLVRWGLDEAERRGGLEAILEASSMGRQAYPKLGFYQDGPEIEYVVDEEFKDRDRPSNIFMRTGNTPSS